MGFKKGTEVEVTSDDDGFRGVWYLGKIITPPFKSDDKNEWFVVVEYNDLVSEDDETKKLSERVHVSLIRPLPPDKDEGVIEVNDVVDVFHMDGWWVGFVERVVGNDEFLVCFDDPPDKMLVKRPAVRLHFNWVDNLWVKAGKKITSLDPSRLSMLSDHPGNSKRQNGSVKNQQPERSCASTGMHYLLDMPIVNHLSPNITLNADTEKKDTDVNDKIVEKVCNKAEVDMSVKEPKGASAKNCETPSKKHQKSKIMDQEMHTVDDFSRPVTLSGYSRRQKARAKKQQAGISGSSTEKKATSIHDETVEKEGDAEKVNISVKELKGVSAKNCETPLKKVQQNKSMDHEMHSVEVSGRLAMLSIQSGSSTRRSRRVKNQQAEKGSLSTKKKNKTTASADIVEKECITEVVKGAQFAKDCEASQKKDQKKQSMNQEITTVDSTNGSIQSDVSSKRKRGRPIGKGSLGDKRKRFSRKMNMEDSGVGNEAETNAENDCLMQTPVDVKFNLNHVQPSCNDSLKVAADKNHTGSVHRHRDLLSKTAIITLFDDLAGETFPSKRVRQSKNSLSNEDVLFNC